MTKYITIENDCFQLYISSTIQDYGNKILEYSTNKLLDYLNFFKKHSYGGKIKASFFVSRKDFINRIKTLCPHANVPNWASGCFYGGEIQILLSPDNLYSKFYTLAHETFHLLFQKFIYKAQNRKRIVWLDESLAINFDGSIEKLIENGDFKKIVTNLKRNYNLPKMNDLEFSKNNIKTREYNGYDLFKIVGRYLIETKNIDELLQYINNEHQIIKDGNNILEKSIQYFSNK